MAFRKDKTGVAQTAANTAAQLTAALVEAGVLKTAAAVDKYFEGRYEATFAPLAVIVEEDNKVFAEADAAEAASGGTRRRSSRSGGSQPKGETPGEPGDVAFFGGKFKGSTIAEVYAMSEDEAKEFNHQYGDGSTYIINYVATDKNTNDTTREAAKKFLAAQPEG